MKCDCLIALDPLCARVRRASRCYLRLSLHCGGRFRDSSRRVRRVPCEGFDGGRDENAVRKLLLLGTEELSAACTAPASNSSFEVCVEASLYTT